MMYRSNLLQEQCRQTHFFVSKVWYWSHSMFSWSRLLQVLSWDKITQTWPLRLCISWYEQIEKSIKVACCLTMARIPMRRGYKALLDRMFVKRYCFNPRKLIDRVTILNDSDAMPHMREYKTIRLNTNKFFILAISSWVTKINFCWTFLRFRK